MTIPDDYKKFLASAPVAQREYKTLEIYHPDFLQTLWFVQDNASVTLRLEADDPRYPSANKLFSPLTMSIQEPTIGGDLENSLSVSLGAVGGEVRHQLNQITTEGWMTPVSVVYRKYYSGDLTNPIMVLRLSASNLVFSGYTNITFTAEDIDLMNKFCGELYTTRRFPMLAND